MVLTMEEELSPAPSIFLVPALLQPLYISTAHVTSAFIIPLPLSIQLVQLYPAPGIRHLIEHCLTCGLPPSWVWLRPSWPSSCGRPSWGPPPLRQPSLPSSSSPCLWKLEKGSVKCSCKPNS